MLLHAFLLLGCLADEPKIEPEHARNEVYKLVLSQGIEAGGQVVKLPAPRMLDGQDAGAQRAALREVAGSDRAADDLLRPSVTAPYIIKVRDVKAGGAIIRVVDLWFIVYADIAQIDPAQEAARSDNKEVEVANMLFQTRLLKTEDLRAAKLKPPVPAQGLNEWYAHIHARLLDRIEFEVTNRIVASQSAETMVVASRTDPAFGSGGPFGNVWKQLPTAANPQPDGSVKPYAGGISYAKISRLTVKRGSLLVEMHAAFVEPEGWFAGAPILRSKWSVVAQDQIRRLRRNVARDSQNSPASKPAPARS